jgi:hypothetical protein
MVKFFLRHYYALYTHASAILCPLVSLNLKKFRNFERFRLSEYSKVEDDEPYKTCVLLIVENIIISIIVA